MSTKRKLSAAQRRLNAVLLAGEKMANLCFNLKQGICVSERHREVMGECQREWDAAKNTLYARQRRRK